MRVADCLSCYVHLAESHNGDARVVDIFHPAISRRWGDDVEQFLRLVCSIHSQESAGRQETSVTLRHHKWLCKDDNITYRAEEVVVKNPNLKKNKNVQGQKKHKTNQRPNCAEIKTNMR